MAVISLKLAVDPYVVSHDCKVQTINQDTTSVKKWIVYN